MLRRLLLLIYRVLYRVARIIVFRTASAQQAHERVLRLLRWCDNQGWLQPLIRLIHRMAFASNHAPHLIGGVTLSHPVILAAGFVKGDGFTDEAAARQAIHQRRNFIPGWRTMPNLVGAVEFGSLTRYPRIGNPGTVIWRDVETRSTQNRIGLKNPGVQAAAILLQERGFPAQCGINIAVSPGIEDQDQEARELLESFEICLTQGLHPAWFTLNLSCPNTEDDPQGNQTEDKARHLCGTIIERLKPLQIPLWVKIGPDLSDEQYQKLMEAFAEAGVQAVIATNTLSAPVPDDPTITAGIGGGKLHDPAVRVVQRLAAEKQKHGYTIDIIGCGGVMDQPSYRDFINAGAVAVQYWSGMVYEGPLVGALIVA